MTAGERTGGCGPGGPSCAPTASTPCRLRTVSAGTGTTARCRRPAACPATPTHDRRTASRVRRRHPATSLTARRDPVTMAPCLPSAPTPSCPPVARRSPCTPPTACAGRRARAARGPRPGRDAGLPAPAADARRDDGQPRAPQGGLPAARARRLAVLRFNTRGTSSVQGTSEGTFDNGRRGAVRRRGGHRVRRVPRPAGHLGAGLVVRHRPGADARRRPGRAGRGAALAAAAVQHPTSTWPPGRTSGKPLVALVPEHDDYLQPPEARERFAAVPQAEVVGVDGRQAPVGRGRREGARPGGGSGSRPSVDVPLPTEWDGPMETADTSAYADRRPRRSRTCRPSSGPPGGGRRTSRTSSMIAAAVGIASSAPTTPSSDGADQRGDHDDRAGQVDRARHHPRVDHVVLELLVDDVEDHAGEPDVRVGREADRGDDHRARAWRRSSGSRRAASTTAASATAYWPSPTDEQEDQRADARRPCATMNAPET